VLVSVSDPALRRENPLDGIVDANALVARSVDRRELRGGFRADDATAPAQFDPTTLHVGLA
jgi:hypothetical protein